MKETKFKHTEVGMIPSDWEVNVATLINGRAYSQSELLERGKYRVLRVGNFGTNDSWYYSNLELPEKMYCNKGDLLYCWSCTYGAYIWNEEKTIYHYHIWKIADLKAEKGYLQYILNNDVAQQMNSSNGSTMSHITKGFLENRLFVFPPTIEEQQRIANALSDVDSLINNLEKLIAKKKNIKQGAMQQLLTGKKRLKGFDGEWCEKKLGEIADYFNGLSHEGKQKNTGKYELINLNSISIDGGLKPSGKYIDDGFDTLKENDLVMVLSDVAHGDLLGRVALIPEDNKYVLNQRVALLRIKDNSVFAYFLFFIINANQHYFKTEGAGSSQLNLSKNSVTNFIVKMPPLEEQCAISKVLSDMDSEIEALEQKLTKVRKIKQGMMQELLTGKIRLV